MSATSIAGYHDVLGKEGDSEELGKPYPGGAGSDLSQWHVFSLSNGEQDTAQSCYTRHCTHVSMHRSVHH